MAVRRVVAVTVEAFRKRCARSIGTGQVTAQRERDVFIDRAGMRFLLLHAQFGQQIDNDARFHLKLPRQLVDSDFLHRRDCSVNSLFDHHL
jgi:hypothetical protein